MKPWLFGERHAKLSQTSVNPIIGAVQLRVPIQTPVLHLRQLRRQSGGDREASAAVSHVIREANVLDMTLRRASDIIEPTVIVLPQNAEKILRHEDSIVVSHNEPPDAVDLLRRGIGHLGDDPRDPDRRSVTVLVPVGEVGSVGGNPNFGERLVLRHRLVEPDCAAHLGGPPPLLDVGLAAVPVLGGGGDAEGHVAEGGWVLAGVWFGVGGVLEVEGEVCGVVEARVVVGEVDAVEQVTPQQRHHQHQKLRHRCLQALFPFPTAVCLLLLIMEAHRNQHCEGQIIECACVCAALK